MRELPHAYPYVCDTIYENAPFGSNAVVIAYGVGADGHIEVISIDAVGTESKNRWISFLRNLKKRRLARLRIAINVA